MDLLTSLHFPPTSEAAETSRNIFNKIMTSTTGPGPHGTDLYLLDYLSITYFKCNESFFRQQPGGAVRSTESPMVANLYMEDMERRALGSFRGTTRSHCF